jgi:glyoxylase-like metal-dependent hydrolase (beta-lactamase superfamily II)
MSETTQQWKIGEARITSVVEAQTDGIPPGFFLTGADEAIVLRHEWLLPHYADADGRIGMRVQAFVIEVAGRLVVVDPCVGNGKTREMPFWNEQEWPFMERFEAAGFDRSDVDTVVHTHLHVDHVGWDTHRRDGRWVPTFARARHVYVASELDAQAADVGIEARRIRDDSIVPVFEAGLADIVEADTDLGGGLRLSPTPGHTPGHASLWLTSGEEAALVTGDVIHHPLQCAEPSLAFTSDHDVALARATREETLAAAAQRAALVLGTHFPSLPGGRVAPDGEAWRFVPEPGVGAPTASTPAG